VYHATSASSHPGGTADFFQRMHCFWSANPPPFRLPWCRWVCVCVCAHTRVWWPARGRCRHASSLPCGRARVPHGACVTPHGRAREVCMPLLHVPRTAPGTPRCGAATSPRGSA
jgi:hypothetical protein